jgi:phospholipid/cholesterol/gamma-HCH transport system permease protein
MAATRVRRKSIKVILAGKADRMKLDDRDAFTATVKGGSGVPTVLTLSGRLVIGNVHRLLSELDDLISQKAPPSVKVDLAELAHIDSAGVLALMRLEDSAREKGIPFAMEGASPEVRGIMNIVDRESLSMPPIHPEKTVGPMMEAIGEATLSFCHDFIAIMTFMGDLVIALGYSVLHPRSVRWGDVINYMKKAGAEALPIVGLISLLIGLIMAFMSSLQLKQFGANIYVASLVGISIVKELGPMMTAIIVAGRSGSAFAAEIGTMMVNEEVDALVTMGFDPILFLAVPKVIAAIIVVPILTLYAMLFGILGGLLVGVLGLDLTLFTYLHQSLKSVDLFDVLTSLFKAGVFAALIAGIGCQRGFQVFGGAEAVGETTTSAVVSAIFLIIIADSAFAILLHYIH